VSAILNFQNVKLYGGGGHIDFQIEANNCSFVKYHSMFIHVMFGFLRKIIFFILPYGPMLKFCLAIVAILELK
jgi:uncharacterized membrane protein